MPRQPFSSLPSSSKTRSTHRQQARAAKRPGKRASLDALALAESSWTENPKVKHGRLGEVDEDGSRRGVASEERSTKRRKMDGGDDEDSEQESDDRGSDSEGNEWHFGVDGEDNDSDIDSDEAMGDSDEEKFEKFTFRGSSTIKKPRAPNQAGRSKRTSKNLDLSEGQDDLGSEEDEDGLGEEDEDGLSEEAIDLGTALDMNVVAEQADEDEKNKGAKRRNQISESSSDEDEDQSDMEPDEDDTRSSIFSASESEVDDTGNHSKLLSFVEDLNGQDAKSKKVPRQAFLSYMDEPPSDFGIKPTKKLTAADLLPTITDPRLRQSLRMLHAAEKEQPQSRSNGTQGKLAPPLAKRQQDRLDREAAYDKSKETLNKWIDTVKENRRAEHISFPLPDPDAQSALGSRQLLPTSSSAPMTNLEVTIHDIMVESGLLESNGQLVENKFQTFEELEEEKIPLEEVQARRAELRKTRDLMFREEVRAKRIKKIKSKAFRRVHRKERDRATQEERAALTAAGVFDSEEERGANDRRRAEERMGARHRESRWAKGVKAAGRAAWDEDARSGVTDLARRDEELRRRIEGKRGIEEDENGGFTSSSDSGDHAFPDSSDEAEVAQLGAKLGRLEADESVAGSTSRLNNLGFMQKAEAARKATNDAEIRAVRRGLGEDDFGSPSEDEEHVNGRQKFGSRPHSALVQHTGKSEQNEFEEPLSEEEQDGEKQSSIAEDRRALRRAGHVLVPKETNWGKDPHGAEGRFTHHRSDNIFPKNPWLSSKREPKSREQPKDVTISATPLPNPKANAKSRAASNGRFTTNEQAGTTLTEGPDSDEEAPNARAVQSTRNQELVRLAFAGDDVFEDFAKEKDETVREDGDQVIDNSLPGWGSWTGNGISKKAQRRNAARFKTTIKGVQEDKRKDAKLDRVIINEKKVKKNSKYLATELPHPFESRQQYERSLRLPLGPEWTTKNTFQDATKPRVLLKQGVIRPMAKPLV